MDCSVMVWALGLVPVSALLALVLIWWIER